MLFNLVFCFNFCIFSSKECDFAISIVPTNSRVALADVSHSQLHAVVSYVIPKPDSSVNFFAVVEPFELKVNLDLK